MLTSYVLASLLQFTVIILGEKKSIFMSWNQVFKKKRKKTKEQAKEELVLLGRNLVSLANCLNHFGLRVLEVWSVNVQHNNITN